MMMGGVGWKGELSLFDGIGAMMMCHVDFMRDFQSRDTQVPEKSIWAVHFAMLSENRPMRHVRIGRR
jgi:hypothetical protein